MTLKDIKETDLHEPVVKWLRERDCEIQAEIQDLDILGVYSQPASVIDNVVPLTIGVELKKTLNLEVIGQAVNRQKYCDAVYVAIANQRGLTRKKRFKEAVGILKRLNIGLLIVSLENNISGEIKCHLTPDYPSDVKRVTRPVPRLKKKLLKEFSQRKLSVNTGGSTRTKQMTAYKEQCYEMARQMADLGIAAPKDLKDIPMTSSEKSRALTKNYYGWFEKVAHGQYRLTACGIDALRDFEMKYGE